MLALAVVLLTAATGSVSAEPEPIVVVGLGRVAISNRRAWIAIEEPQHLRERVSAAIRAVVQRPILDHPELRDALGSDYLDKFTSCRSEPTCVIKLVSPLSAPARLAIYGDYEVHGADYRFRLRVVDLRERRLVSEAQFTLRGPELAEESPWRRDGGRGARCKCDTESELEEESLWKREVRALLVSAGVEIPPEPSPKEDGPPALPDLNTGNPDTSGGGGKGFVEGVDALARGILWHGYFQFYAAAGVRDERRGDLLLFENRLQLEFESKVGPLGIVGRPEIIYDGLSEDFRVAVRELYAARYYRTFDLSVGERILTWGITDFWPVVDIVNPRDFSRLRNWRPIDEKLPAPVIHSTLVRGPVTLQALGVALTRSSRYQLDRTQPFAIPIAVPDSIPIVRQDQPDRLSGGGGGGAIAFARGSWKTSLYGLWGRNPLPTVFVRVDPSSGAPEVRVENERVAMGAASVQGTIDALKALIKAEAAYYRRIDDRCEGAAEVAPGTPSCFYLRRVPTARATAAIEREIVEGLDAHVQFITEITRRGDVPVLPAATMGLAPGLVPQHRFNQIVTLRLQGRWARGDFRPSAFIYWSHADQDWFSNLDLEYHLTDGFAVAVGGFWFQGYASDSKNRFTIAGSLEQSSNGYLRVTAWF